jgi:hypothetical protein
LSNFKKDPIQFRLRDSTVYYLDSSLKIYTYFQGSYLSKNIGTEISSITAIFLLFDISTDNQLLVFMLDDFTLNTLTYNPTSTFF